MTIITPDSIASHWRITPEAVAWPGRTGGLSAAVFSGRGSKGLELASPGDDATHVLTVELQACRLEFDVDGRRTHDGLVARGTAQIVRAGESAVARVSGDWRIIQFYVPADDLRALAVELGVSDAAARSLEILDPGFTVDPMLARIGYRLARQLVRAEIPRRLELDELALDVGKRLLRRHANVVLPTQRRAPRLSAGEIAAVEAARDDNAPSLALLSVLLDRPFPELSEALRGAILQARAQQKHRLH